jgi:hypothetical protein
LVGCVNEPFAHRLTLRERQSGGGTPNGLSARKTLKESHLQVNTILVYQASSYTPVRPGLTIASTKLAANANRGFQLQKRSQLFIGIHNETLSVVAMCVCNRDRSPVGINRRDAPQLQPALRIVHHLRGRFASFKLGAHLLDLHRLFFHGGCEGDHARF